MPQDHFVSELRRGYEALHPAERKQKISELVGESEDTANFIREEFPEFFIEAFPPAPSNESRSRGHQVRGLR